MIQDWPLCNSKILHLEVIKNSLLFPDICVMSMCTYSNEVLNQVPICILYISHYQDYIFFAYVKILDCTVST